MWPANSDLSLSLAAYSSGRCPAVRHRYGLVKGRSLAAPAWRGCVIFSGHDGFFRRFGPRCFFRDNSGHEGLLAQACSSPMRGPTYSEVLAQYDLGSP